MSSSEEGDDSTGTSNTKLLWLNVVMWRLCCNDALMTRSSFSLMCDAETAFHAHQDSHLFTWGTFQTNFQTLSWSHVRFLHSAAFQRTCLKHERFTLLRAWQREQEPHRNWLYLLQHQRLRGWKSDSGTTSSFCLTECKTDFSLMFKFSFPSEPAGTNFTQT